MKQASCARLWQAEAIEDGRLSGPDVASFERHAETCPECIREVAELTRLRSALPKLPVLTSKPLERHRLRSEILTHANAGRLREPSRFRRRGVPALVFAAALSLVLALVVSNMRARPLSVAPTASAPAFEMEPSTGAEWRTEELGPTVRHRIVRGRIAFHVHKLEHGQRFILRLPDGELEVKGTRFVVDIDDSRTKAVSCSEGRVALRFDGSGEEILLAAGDAWPKMAAPTPADPPPASAVPPVASSGPVVVAPPQPPRRAAGLDRSSAGTSFVEAMSAFSEGDLGRAERLFLAFEQQHPQDSRVEDAAFLRAVARARRGDKEGARDLAREYLRRYPGGLRQAEAEQLAR